MKAPLTVVCSGVNSMFRDSLNDAKPEVASTFVGVLLKDVNTKIPFPNHGNVILTNCIQLMYPVCVLHNSSPAQRVYFVYLIIYIFMIYFS